MWAEPGRTVLFVVVQQFGRGFVPIGVFTLTLVGISTNKRLCFLRIFYIRFGFLRTYSWSVFLLLYYKMGNGDCVCIGLYF